MRAIAIVQVSGAKRRLRSCGICDHLRGDSGKWYVWADHNYTCSVMNLPGIHFAVDQNVRPIDAMGRTGHSDMRMLSHYSHPKTGKIHEDQFEFMQNGDEDE